MTRDSRKDPRGLFITGTDTGVGKTYVGTALVRSLRLRGVDVGVFKPVETGCQESDGGLQASDAEALRREAGVSDPIDLVCPYRLREAAAPSVAARAETTEISSRAIRSCFLELSRRHRFVIVEGAGGLLVPLDEQCYFPDLIRLLDLPVLLVARARLGTINHTLLTLACLQAEKLPTLGVLVNHVDGPPEGAERMNLDALTARLGSLFIAEVPQAGDSRNEAWCRLVEERCSIGPIRVRARPG